LLDPGDITEAVAMAATAGDPLGLPQDAAGAHGINDDRITAFMRGYLGGVEACALPEEGSRLDVGGEQLYDPPRLDPLRLTADSIYRLGV
jgi:hypothetical protein